MENFALKIGEYSIPSAGNVPTGGILTSIITIRLGLQVIIISAIVVAIAYLIWGGINWIMSEGDKQKLEKARQKIVFAIIGLIVVFISFLIINTLARFFLGRAIFFDTTPCPPTGFC